ncbi:MAG: ferritin-like domain-containing protein [Janthinobacterium lividum]
MDLNGLTIAKLGLKRRGVLRTGGFSAAALGALSLAGLTSKKAEAQTADIDLAVLNFALNLEYLEAEFYLRGLSGTGLSAADIGTSPGAVTGGTAVPFTTSAAAQYAAEIAGDELNHVRFLRAAITAAGGTPVDRPQINLSTSFTAAAQAAGLINSSQTFNPFADEASFLLGAYIFEDVGVTAYAGAAALITNKTYLTAAASILAVEAYHAGQIRTRLAAAGQYAATAGISALRAAASQPTAVPDDQGILVGGALNITPTDANSLVFTRTTTQVLNIVYLGATASANSFFPAGLNGAIK